MTAIDNNQSAFLTEFDPRLTDNDSVWIIREPLIYQSPTYGLCVVPGGFYTDFASVPRLPIIYELYGNRAHREGALHDWAFRKDAINPATGKPFTFMEANNLFLEAMECRGKPWYVRYPMYSAVCVGSYLCFHKKNVGDKL
jgi:hypothetical protein